MKTELTKQFVKKTIRKTVIFTIIMVVVMAIFQSMSPVVTNDIALTQMENSNEMFVMMNTYNKIKPIFNTTYIFIILAFIFARAKDTYKFAKNINNEKEN